jgi:putative tryptophan/tyrosine transport system substrate-binding protein
MWRRSAFAVSLVSAFAGSAGFAQAPGHVFRVGLLCGGPNNSTICGPAMVKHFVERGYQPDVNVQFENRAAQGKLERLPEFASELADSHVDLIMTMGFPAAVAAKEKAPNVPVVVLGAGDPVATGLVESLARPGGEVTGVSEIASELSAKRLELLKEAIPTVRTVAVLWNADDLAMTLRYKAVEAEGGKLGVSTTPLGVRAPDDFKVAFAAMSAKPPDAILMITDVLTALNRGRVIDFAAAHKIPAIYEYAYNVQEGGLMAYGPDMDVLYDRAAGLADRILKGAKPAELPLELPTRLRLSVNLKTAQALGIEMPESIVLRADDVIE